MMVNPSAGPPSTVLSATPQPMDATPAPSQAATREAQTSTTTDSQPGPQTTMPASLNGATAAAAPVPTQHHHPHIPNADPNPARVFKLQFDARRIICCSQTSDIVGWDFCNGDSELEEASRFFATIG